MNYEEIEFSIDGGVALIELNRPGHYNAYTPDMGEELVHAIRAAAGNPDLSALVITGRGKVFCAGAEREFLAGKLGRCGKPLGEEAFITSFTEEFAALPLLTVVAFNGAAAGIGITGMLAADIRIAAEDAKLVLNFAELGIMPGLGTTYFLPRLVGDSAARELLLSSRRIDGRMAATLGLVNRAVPQQQVMPVALELARGAAGCKPGMIAAIKQGLAAGGGSSLGQAVALERQLAIEVRQ